MHEECGVFGIFNKEDMSIDVAKLTYFALYALQHRGGLQYLMDKSS